MGGEMTGRPQKRLVEKIAFSSNAVPDFFTLAKFLSDLK